MARAPENTMAALRLAISEGAEGFEFDVRVTADGVPVLLHDASVDRTTSGSGTLSSLDARDVAALDAGDGHGPPRLDDVLREFLGSVVLGLEMKEILPDPVLDGIGAAHAATPAARLVVGSFDAAAVARAKARIPDVPRALILSAPTPVPPPEQVQELGLWGVFAHESAVDGAFVTSARARGLSVWAYPVNDPDRARTLAGLGLEGLISDDPGRLRPALPRAGSAA
jgi:glycerophosphoryl diester phosphodiesterase